MQTCCPTQTAIKCAEGYACTYQISSDVAERVLSPLKSETRFKTSRSNDQTARYQHFLLQFAENGNPYSVSRHSRPQSRSALTPSHDSHEQKGKSSGVENGVTRNYYRITRQRYLCMNIKSTPSSFLETLWLVFSKTSQLLYISWYVY